MGGMGRFHRVFSKIQYQNGPVSMGFTIRWRWREREIHGLFGEGVQTELRASTFMFRHVGLEISDIAIWLTVLNRGAHFGRKILLISSFNPLLCSSLSTPK